MVISEKKKAAGVFCCAYRCKNEPVKKKGGLCNTCYTRKRRKKDPIYTRYGQFKGNAKKRGKEFTITYEQFKRFCERTGYLIDRGRRGYNATIDRRCNAHGYHIWKIQLLTHSQNCRKGNRFSEPIFTNPNLDPSEVWGTGEVPF